MRHLNLDQLQAFVQVVESGSFSAAAKRLNLTQPAVSLQVRELERRLGVRLIERVGRRALPSAAGTDLLEHAARIDTVVAEALDAVAGHREGGVGRVRLATGATACTYLLPGVLSDLRRRWPALEIIVSTGNTPEVLRAVEENAVDAALVTLPAPGRAFAVTPVWDDELVAVFAKRDAPAVGAALDPEALMHRPLVFYGANSHTRRVIDDWFLAAGQAPKPTMELENVEAIKELVAAGLGCSILPALCMSGRSAGDRRLVTRPLAPAVRRELGLVMRRDKVPDAGLKALVQALEAVG